MKTDEKPRLAALFVATWIIIGFATWSLIRWQNNNSYEHMEYTIDYLTDYLDEKLKPINDNIRNTIANLSREKDELASKLQTSTNNATYWRTIYHRLEDDHDWYRNQSKIWQNQAYILKECLQNAEIVKEEDEQVTIQFTINQPTLEMLREEYGINITFKEVIN